MRKILVLSMIAVALATVQGWCAQGVSRQELGRTVKLTILVDKVMQPVEGWVTKEWMIKAAADAGFNVFSPRRGHERLQEVRDVTEWCRKYGIYHMPWMRGTLEAPKGPEADGKRVVWASGNEQPLWSPNSDEFWEWTARYIVEYAKISANNKHLMGVFLDYENYAPGKEGNLYSLSYDDVILKRFAQARGIEIPKLELGARKSQRTEAARGVRALPDRALARAVSRAAPGRGSPRSTFQFGIYPARHAFMLEAPPGMVRPGPIIWPTPDLRPASRFLPQAEALEANRRILQRGIETAKVGRSFYAGHRSGGARRRSGFSGTADELRDTDGYWIFYGALPIPSRTMPLSGSPQPRHRWRRFNARRDPQTEETGRSPSSKIDKLRKLILPQVTGKRVKFPSHLRGENLSWQQGRAAREPTLQNVLRKFPRPHLGTADASMQAYPARSGRRGRCASRPRRTASTCWAPRPEAAPTAWSAPTCRSVSSPARISASSLAPRASTSRCPRVSTASP